jgi:hypothetical protein
VDGPVVVVVVVVAAVVVAVGAVVVVVGPKAGTAPALVTIKYPGVATESGTVRPELPMPAELWSGGTAVVVVVAPVLSVVVVDPAVLIPLAVFVGAAVAVARVVLWWSSSPGLRPKQKAPPHLVRAGTEPVRE